MLLRSWHVLREATKRMSNLPTAVWFGARERYRQSVIFWNGVRANERCRGTDGRLKTYIIRLHAYYKSRRQQDLYLSHLLNQSYADAAFDALQTALNLWMAVYGISKHGKPKLGRRFVFRKIKKKWKRSASRQNIYLAYILIYLTYIIDANCIKSSFKLTIVLKYISHENNINRRTCFISRLLICLQPEKETS